MVENRLVHIILAILLEKYAYSLATVDWQGRKHLLLRFRNFDNVNEFLHVCRDEDIAIGPGELSKRIAEVMCTFSSPTNGKCEMLGKWNNEDFFIGEILRINLKSRGHLELMKVDNARWWITSVDSTDSLNMDSLYFIPNDAIGPNTLLKIGIHSLDVESVDFIVATDEFRQLDRVMYPCFYCTSTPSDLNIEKSLIIPLYKEIKNQTEFLFNRWRDIALSAFKNGLDYKTVWYVTNAIVNQYNKMYRWS